MNKSEEDKLRKLYFDPNLPKNFFDDVILSPNFYKPENYELELTTHNSIRNMLFYQTTQRIQKVEYFYLKKDSDYFQFKELRNIEKPTILDKFIDKIKFNYYQKKVIGIKEFTYERNKKEKRYKVKYYHDLNKETFYCLVYPRNYFDRILNLYYKKFSKLD